MHKFLKNLFLSFLVFSAGCSGKSPDGEYVDKTGNDSFYNIPEAEIELYTYSDAVIPSVYYSVSVNGNMTMVIPTDEHDVCAFGCAGPVLVTVSYNADNVEVASVLPLSKGYDSRIKDGKVEIIMSPGDRTVLEINGSEDKNLFLFANPLETDRPSFSDPNVKYFKAGTVSDISVLSVYSGQTVYIEGGAIVKGGLSALDVSDIKVRGCGILDARGFSSRGIQFHKVNGLVIENIIMFNDINWSNLIAGADNVEITNYKVVALENPEHETGCENDALDILGCRDVVVKGCFGYCHDDVFCVKSHKWDYKGTVRNVLFEDCIAWNYLSGNSFVVGAETNEDVTGVTYRNCYSIHSGGRPTTLFRGGLSVHHCAGGHMSDILFENIWLEDCKEYGIYLDIRKSYVQNLGNGVSWTPGTLDGLELRNVNILKKPKYGSVIAGYDNDEHKLKNVRFVNLVQEGVKITEVNASTVFSISNADCSFE